MSSKCRSRLNPELKLAVVNLMLVMLKISPCHNIRTRIIISLRTNFPIAVTLSLVPGSENLPWWKNNNVELTGGCVLNQQYTYSVYLNILKEIGGFTSFMDMWQQLIV